MGKKLKQRERIQLQQEMDALNGIVSEIEIENRVEKEVYRNVISPMQSIYSTSEYLIKIARNADQHKEQIKIWRMYLFTYEKTASSMAICPGIASTRQTTRITPGRSAA